MYVSLQSITFDLSINQTLKLNNMKTFGFYLNGETLLKTVKCSDLKAAKGKLDFHYPVNFNIQIKEVKLNN